MNIFPKLKLHKKIIKKLNSIFAALSAMVLSTNHLSAAKQGLFAKNAWSFISLPTIKNIVFYAIKISQKRTLSIIRRGIV
jgi:hypothetical protein